MGFCSLYYTICFVVVFYIEIYNVSQIRYGSNSVPASFPLSIINRFALDILFLNEKSNLLTDIFVFFV